MKKVIFGLAGVLVVIAMVALYQLKKNESPPVAFPNKLEKNVIEKALEKRDWKKIEELLTKSKDGAASASLLRAFEKVQLDENDSKQLFDTILLSLSSQERLLPRAQVLSVRIFEKMNLSVDQTQRLREYFHDPQRQRFESELLPLAVSGTTPYPEDLEKIVLGKFLKGSSPSACMDGIYTLTNLQDTKAKVKISQGLVESFNQVLEDCKLVVAQYLNRAGLLADAKDRNKNSIKRYLENSKNHGA